jgi:hypothetical protein
MKEIDPNYCFSLPDDRDRLLENMRVVSEEERSQNKQQLWVLKEDYPVTSIYILGLVSVLSSRKWSYPMNRIKEVLGHTYSTASGESQDGRWYLAATTRT